MRVVAGFPIALYAVLVLSSVISLPATAKTDGPATAQSEGFDRNSELDKIFQELGLATSETKARAIADRFWLTWMTAPDEETAEWMNQALRARGGYNLQKALGYLNAIIEKHPDYAEAWNQRATIHYMQSNFEQSLKDCEVTLSLAPRHLGCLSGSALILIRHLNQHKLGKRFLNEAIRLHPWIYERVLLKEIPTIE